ncbi:MAG: DedA family protein [Gemmataceae bacterium]|nr:DedA family protein [Planctomycetia bacterium]MBX3400177.1 DedA family protein [Gemmataceae bacterium]
MIESFAKYGYVGIFSAIIATGFGLPMPEELPVLFSGVLVGHADTMKPGMTELPPERLRWWIMLPVVIVAIVVGDGLLYGVGRWWGHKLFEAAWVKRRILTPETRAIIEKNLQERGIMVLLTARLTPGIRTPIFLMAGHYRVSFTKFLIADGLYAIPGVMVMFWLAYFLTDQVLEVFHKIEQYRQLLVFGILCAVGGVILYRLLINRRVTTGESKDVPMIVRPVEKVTEAMEHAVEKAFDAVVHMGHAEEKPKAEGSKPPESSPAPSNPTKQVTPG